MFALEALVDFKFGIDCQKMSKYKSVHKGLCCSYHDLNQNIENFHVRALNGIAFNWKNWYFPPKVSLLISSKKSLENLSIWKVLVKALFQRNWLKIFDVIEICSFW